MTEHEWLHGREPGRMLEWLRPRADPRKLRLFACACAARFRHFWQDPACAAAVEAAERYADGQIGDAELHEADLWFRVAFRRHMRGGEPDATTAAACAATACVRPQVFDAADYTAAMAASAAYHSADARERRPSEVRLAERARQCDVLREIFGNPFRPAALDPAWAAWNDHTPAKIARAIYDERDWGRLPILADALEDAGCDDAALLAHLRGPGPHVRGCWAVDLIAGHG